MLAARFEAHSNALSHIGVKLSLERRTTLGFGIAALALLLIGSVAWWNAGRYRETVLRVDHTHQVLNRLERVLTDVLSLQSSVRGYALTGGEEMLEPYAELGRQLDALLRELHELVADNPVQQRALSQLEPAIAQLREILDRHIAARRAQPAGSSVLDPAAFLRGRETMEEIRRLGAAMETEERQVMQRQIDRMNVAGRWTIITILVASTLSIASVLAAGFFLRRDLQVRAGVEAQLRVSEERIRLMVDSVKDYAIIMLDPTGHITGWNAGAERLKGYTKSEILGQHFSRFYPEDVVRSGFPDQELRVATDEGRFENEGWRVRRDGTRFWAHVIITAVRAADGDLLGFIKVTRDLTEQREARARIEALNDDLRRRATQLEAANRELEAFSYSVSHDLRAPLRHIDGFANLLSNHAGDSLDAESRRFLATISRAAKQMGELIDDLLTFSRIGRAPLRLTKVNHGDLVAQVIGEARYDEGRTIQWEIGSLPETTGDASLLRQVWRNLLDNAVKYSSKAAQPRIAIDGRLEASTGEYVFSVRDNGVGFDMAYADKLFGVFQRLHGPTEFEGTGIGLANVRRIVSRHHGRTWAEGRVGEGATFYFSLPVTPPTSLASV
jgi:PAS domain S-box-containing protein